MHLIAAVYIIISILEKGDSFCPSLCSCTFHDGNDDPRTRSVLCNDPDMLETPANIPVDAVKLQIEKTVIRKIPKDAFYYLVDLKYLWLTYNSITTVDTNSFYNLKQLHELRLGGNLLLLFPWESLAEMPSLRTLDLHNNKMTTIPADASRYLKHLTYLDISSNKLISLPSDLMDIWLPFSETETSRNTGYPPQRVILGVQDNPWYCDCQISKLIDFSRILDTTVILLDPFVACNGPESLAGIMFQRAELEQCLKPSVMTSATKITSSLGSNVLLRCDATGYPTPHITWVKSNNIHMNYTVIQESPEEGVRWAIISMTGISYKDAGDYRCKAKNVAGTSEASVTLIVIGYVTTRPSPQKYWKKNSTEEPNTPREESLNVTFSSTITSTAISSTVVTTTEQSTIERETESKQPKSTPGDEINVHINASGSKNQQGPLISVEPSIEQTDSIQNLRVIPETNERVTLRWQSRNAFHSSAMTVLYSKYGENNMLPLSLEPTKNEVTIDGLEPNIQYVACVFPKGDTPTKDQCILFFTDKISLEYQSPVSMWVVVSGLACAMTIPIIFFLLYKVIMLHKQPTSIREDDLVKETYLKFETLSLKPDPVGSHGEVWAHQGISESDRLLLCSRTSRDSQVTLKSQGSWSEYVC